MPLKTKVYVWFFILAKKIISCSGEWPTDAVEAANTQLISSFFWELDFESLVSPREKYQKNCLVI